MIWNRCPKETYVGLTTLRLGVMDAVCHFNCGSVVELEILKRLNITPGRNTVIGVQSSDVHKKKSAVKQATPEHKNRRRYLRGRKKIKEDKQTDAEGVIYKAGGF